MLGGDALLFVRVADTRSFKEAARQLQISRSQASKRIATLEQQLGSTLIYRSSRSISLTACGEALLEHCRRICHLAEDARAAVEELSGSPSGRLRLSVPTCLGASLLPRLLEEFSVRYPAVELDAHTSEAFVDIVAGGYDVVIRVARKLTDSNLTAQRLATSPLVVAASPDYLETHGVPAHAKELSRHACLGLRKRTGNDTVWQFSSPEGRISVPVTLACSTDTNLALVMAACAGQGFVYVPEAVIANELRRGALRAVLPEFCRGIGWGVYALYCGRAPSVSGRAFIELVRELLPELDSIDRWAPCTASVRVARAMPMTSSAAGVPPRSARGT